MENMGMILAKIRAHTAMLVIDKIITAFPEDKKNELVDLIDNSVPVAETYADKLKIFKEAVGDEIFNSLSLNGTLKESVEEHFQSIMEGFFRNSYEYLDAAREEFCPDKEMPNFHDFRNAFFFMIQG